MNARVRSAAIPASPIVLEWNRGVPVVPAKRLVFAPPQSDLLVAICPWCARPHVHGAAGKTFGSGDGHRTTDCPSPSAGPGYHIREVEP